MLPSILACHLFCWSCCITPKHNRTQSFLSAPTARHWRQQLLCFARHRAVACKLHCYKIEYCTIFLWPMRFFFLSFCLLFASTNVTRSAKMRNIWLLLLSSSSSRNVISMRAFAVLFAHGFSGSKYRSSNVFNYVAADVSHEDWTIKRMIFFNFCISSYCWLALNRQEAQKEWVSEAKHRSLDLALNYVQCEWRAVSIYLRSVFIFFFLISFLFEHGWKGKYDMHLRARDDKGFGHSILPNWNAVAVLNPATYCATLPHPCRVTIAIKHSMNIRDQMFRRESNAATERVSQNNNSFHISTEWYAIVAGSIVLSQADGYSSRERTAKVPSV